MAERKRPIFRLEDNGCGLGDETMRHMFDKFYQLEKSYPVVKV